MKRLLVLIALPLLFVLGCGENPPAQEKPITAVFIGDSITFMWWHSVVVPPAVCDAIPVMGNLNEHFPPTYINSAIDGQSTPEMIARFETQVVAYHPDVLVIEGGGADLFRGITDPVAIESDVETLVSLARSHGIKPVLVTMTPFAPAYDYLKPMILTSNTMRRAYATEANVPLVDYWTLLADDTGHLPSQYNFCDGLHLTHAAYDRLAGPVGDAIKNAAKN